MQIVWIRIKMFLKSYRDYPQRQRFSSRRDLSHDNLGPMISKFLKMNIKISDKAHKCPKGSLINPSVHPYVHAIPIHFI